MRTFVIVANQTLPSEALRAAVDERLASGAGRFHVVVPATPVVHRLTWSEEESRTEAGHRLEAYLDGLRGRGIEATGEVGDQDVVEAVHDALRDRQVDEIIVSTLQPGLSRWLGQDVPSRIRRNVAVPVTVVSEKESPIAASPGK
jgi:nucleotide-binding universal stress UspA family protein